MLIVNYFFHRQLIPHTYVVMILKFFKKGVQLNVRKNFFSQRVVNDWNILPETVINSKSINMFKYRLDCYLMFSRGTYKLIQLLFPLKEHCFCLTYLFMRLLFYLFYLFLVIPTEWEVQEIKQCSCQVQVCG